MSPMGKTSIVGRFKAFSRYWSYPKIIQQRNCGLDYLDVAASRAALTGMLNSCHASLMTGSLGTGIRCW